MHEKEIFNKSFFLQQKLFKNIYLIIFSSTHNLLKDKNSVIKWKHNVQIVM